MGALNSSAAFRELIAWVSTKLGNSLIIFGLSLRKPKLASVHCAMNLTVDLSFLHCDFFFWKLDWTLYGGGRDGRKSENRSARSMIGVCTKTPETFMKNTWLSLSPGHAYLRILALSQSGVSNQETQTTGSNPDLIHFPRLSFQKHE